MITKNLKSGSKSRFKESLLVGLLEWMPSPLGKVMRRVLYRSIFQRIGKSVQIQMGVEITNAAGMEIGNGTRIDRYVRLRNVGSDCQIRVGDGVRLNRGVDIRVHTGCNGRVEIGDRTVIGTYSCLSGSTIIIGNDCLIAPHVGLFANNHVFTDPNRKIREQKHTYKGIIIEDDCWLGMGVKVVDGVTIGEGSVIGAGAVVTKNIPPYSIAVGVPAKVVGSRQKTSNNSVNSQLAESVLAATKAEVLSECK
ncbi:DapH/DapD/GlmU-related protein [Aerosakkonemataceae cyanobacterium BLCC-F154]|uniref:DapH/DapD/GlmU-related protein n=1 Tax=Floridaenema fluviatile BLCC-F154 TaxID=3153640 RepID=A0ABV4YHH5_9CYAN